MPESTSPRPRNFRQRLIPLLGKVSHASAPFITTFLLIHLSAPALANVGSSSLSSQVMIHSKLLGREYYQTAIGEPYLVLGPIAIHSLSGIIRRALITYPKLKSSFAPEVALSNPTTFFQRMCAAFPVTTLSLAAYTVLLLLPIHFGIHRILPTTTTSPVYSLGPSELNFSFVQYGLQRWPMRTWAMYTVLVGAMITHASEGARVLMNNFNLNTNSNKKPSSSSNTSRSQVRYKLLAAVLAFPVLSGLYFLYTEPLYIFPDMGSRLDGVYRLSWVYHGN